MTLWDDALWDRIDESVERLKESWLMDPQPPLESLAPPPEDPHHLPVLSALIRVDLEHQWLNGNRRPVEEYVASRPGLQSPTKLFAEIVEAECLVRADLGLPVTKSELRQRFGEEVVALLAPEAIGDAKAAKGQAPQFELTPAASRPSAVPMFSQDQSLLPPGTVLGKYMVERFLGQGGMGTVYKATDQVLKRPVAIKVHRHGRIDAFMAGKILLEEAQKVAQLKAPGIVAALDLVKLDETTCFFVMEYVDGESLKKRIAAGGMTPAESVEIAAQVAESLAVAHRTGFVHRDIKPGNILIDNDGRAHITDFGLALDETTQWQHAGEIAGTLPYMAPEQIRQESHLLDGRADIWALGAVLYEMLTGRRAFPATSQAALRDEILQRHPKPPRMIDARIPSTVQDICLKCLSKDVTDRYSCAHDLAVELRAALQPRSRNRGSLVVLCALLLALAGVYGWRQWNVKRNLLVTATQNALAGNASDTKPVHTVEDSAEQTVEPPAVALTAGASSDDPAIPEVSSSDPPTSEPLLRDGPVLAPQSTDTSEPGQPEVRVVSEAVTETRAVESMPEQEAPPTATPAVVESALLMQAIRDGKVNVKITGCERAEENRIRIEAMRSCDHDLELAIEPGTVFVADSDGISPMVVANLLHEVSQAGTQATDHFVLQDNGKHTFLLPAFSITFDKTVPDQNNTLRIQSVNDSLGKLVLEGSKRGVSDSVIQSAVWLKQGVAEEAIRTTMSRETIDEAAQLVAAIKQPEAEPRRSWWDWMRLGIETGAGVLDTVTDADEEAALLRQSIAVGEEIVVLEDSTVLSERTIRRPLAPRRVVGEVHAGERFVVLDATLQEVQIELKSDDNTAPIKGWVSRDRVESAAGENATPQDIREIPDPQTDRAQEVVERAAPDE